MLCEQQNETFGRVMLHINQDKWIANQVTEILADREVMTDLLGDYAEMFPYSAGKLFDGIGSGGAAEFTAKKNLAVLRATLAETEACRRWIAGEICT